MSRMRIVFDASPLLVNKTGIAYYTEGLIASLAKQYPDDLELIGFYYNFLGRLSVNHLPKASNLKFHAVRFTPSKVVYQLRRWGIEPPIEYLSGTRADFVLYPNFLSYPSLSKTPCAPVIHDLAFIDMPETVSAKNRQDLKRFVPKAIKRSDFVITVSDFTKTRIIEEYNVPAEDILVTPIPPAAQRLPRPDEQKKLLAQNSILKPFILFVGTIEPRKNLTELIEAYITLPESIRNAYDLVIAGRMGWNCENEEKAIANAVAQDHGVRHLGYVDDDTRAALFANAELFATASNYEGYGMPVIEAMDAGTAVAASDIPVFKEIASDHAAYFDQNNPKSIASTLARLLSNDNERARIAKEGKQHAQTYKWETVASALYEKIIKSVERRR